MKSVISIALVICGLISTLPLNAQEKSEDKSKRPSPPAKVSQKISTGATISIDYSQPSIKGRIIGKEVEPMDGKVWRTGANEATVFETNKDLSIEGKKLAAGKYGLFTVFNGDNATVIFNKTWKQWGAFDYKEADDALRITTKSVPETTSTEKLTFMISPAGVITLLWGNKKTEFTVK
ncbi:MAG: DUF2911 domain-containing protein [Ginsengibacter sp.]